MEIVEKFGRDRKVWHNAIKLTVSYQDYVKISQFVLKTFAEPYVV